MIRSSKNRTARSLHDGETPRGFPVDVAKRAVDKLFLLHAATRVEDLRVPPGNRLEQLKGDRAGRWSIRINEQWRICFEWRDGSAENVEVVDYH